MVRAGGALARVTLARAAAQTTASSGAPGVSRRRLVRLALSGLLAGAAAGFLGALLRPRSWTEYVEPRAASRT